MAGIDARGVQFQRGDGADPEVFTAIGNVTNVSGPEMERTALDTTAHDSPDGWMEHVGGLKNGGEVSLTLNFDSAKHAILLNDFEDADARNYRLAEPGGGMWTLAAVMTGLSPSWPVEDKQAAEATLQVSGKPTLTPA